VIDELAAMALQTLLPAPLHRCLPLVVMGL
jgi:hypothetical protein